MSEFEYWCEYGKHWVDQTRLSYRGQPICKEDLGRGWPGWANTGIEQQWEKMHRVVRHVNNKERE